MCEMDVAVACYFYLETEKIVKKLPFYVLWVAFSTQWKMARSHLKRTYYISFACLFTTI